LAEALHAHGEDHHPLGADGPLLRTVQQSWVRDEFFAAYPNSSETPEKQMDAKRKAFNRALKTAAERRLVGCRDLAGVDHVWFAAETHGP